MGGYVTTPLSIKKYIKVPPRKLISGFLHINVVSHEDNDGYEDAYTWYRDELADGDQDTDWHSANPFLAQAASNFDESGRTGKKLSFGDYDCLLFWIAGGMTLQDPIMGTHRDNFYLAANGFSEQSVNTWYTSIDDYCQNFIKYDLISRINCGYGHGALMGDETYSGTVPITKNEFRADQSGISGHDCTVTPPNYTATGGTSPNAHGGNFQKHIMSCGSFSHQSTAASPNGEDLNTANKNTFFPPVQSVEVYGQHHTNIVTQTNTDESETLYSINHTGAYHSKEFWNLVIEVKMRGFDDGWTSGSPSQADKEWFKSRTNIFFQPFGETASFNISDTPHTS
jgi:hypothetical protein